MKQKQWFIINDRNQIISIMFNSKEEAMDMYDKLIGERCVCETIYG